MIIHYNINIMATKENKMQWFIDELITDSPETLYNKVDTIFKNRSHGAISCPTGYGKSGIIFKNMIYQILKSKDNDERVILNLSTPIIKLCAQQGVDFLEAFSALCTHFNINKDKVIIFNNNSGQTDKIYNCEDEENVMIKHGYNCYNFRKEFSRMFIEDDETYNIAIVISCHKSLPKFISLINKVSPLNTNIVTYIDESHTISVTDDAGLEADTKVDIQTLGNICNGLYLVSATNKQNIVKIVNSFNVGNDYDGSYIYNVTPQQAIVKNIICSPLIDYIKTGDGKITWQICKMFMKQCQNHNKKIYHKILITCVDTQHLRQLRDELIAAGYHVFSACSADGMNAETILENTIRSYDNIKEFIDAIDNYKGHCFVLHIRQMTSGIDVKSLTDSIIAKSDTNNYNSYDKVIQIIGRTLRLGSEREIDINNRKKKDAKVLFVTPENNDLVASHLAKFMINYYGIDTIRFTGKFAANKLSKSNKITSEMNDSNNIIDAKSVYSIKSVLIDIEEYIKDLAKSKSDFDELGIEFDTELETAIKEIQNKYLNQFNMKEFYLTQYFESPDLMSAVNELLNKYNII